jgi:hypothetical protein
VGLPLALQERKRCGRLGWSTRAGSKDSGSRFHSLISRGDVVICGSPILRPRCKRIHEATQGKETENQRSQRQGTTLTYVGFGARTSPSDPRVQGMSEEDSEGSSRICSIQLVCPTYLRKVGTNRKSVRNRMPRTHFAEAYTTSFPNKRTWQPTRRLHL